MIYIFLHNICIYLKLKIVMSFVNFNERKKEKKREKKEKEGRRERLVYIEVDLPY